MRSHLKSSFLLITILLLGSKLSAQSTDSAGVGSYIKPFSPTSAYRTWSIGVHAGALSNYTVLHGKEDWANQDYDLGYGLYVKKQVLHWFGFQANFLMGQLHGTKNTVVGSPYIEYRTTIDYAGDISGVFTLGNISWDKQQKSIQPYLTAGAGYTFYKPALYDGAGNKTYFHTGGSDVQEYFIPVGAGLKFNISTGVNIDVGYIINFVNSDNIDGNVTGSTFDKFSYAHIGLEFALGKHTKPQLATHNPVAAMRAEYTMKASALQNQIDAEKARNEALRKDLNTTNANLAATNTNLAKFTVDSDNDGVPDFFDKCPNTPVGTPVDGAGCPLPVNKAPVNVYITEADKKVVKDAIANLEFDTGKASIRPSSYPSLDKVAELLMSKNFSLKLAGYTDNTGSDVNNLRLSKSRAESIKTYLVGKGANAAHIEAIGYGKLNPIATNTTPEGRQQNRRVEFTLN
jgi:OOP family OmpA-OmpF porin